MNTTPVKQTTVHLITYSLYLLFLVSLIFSFRAVSSMSIAAIFLTGVITIFLKGPSSKKNKYRLYFVIGCASLLLLSVVAILYTTDVHEGWNNARIKTGLLIVSLAVFVAPIPDENLLRKLLFHYCLLLTLASTYCLGHAFARYQQSGSASVFFYHSLVNPIAQHAIYFSLMILFGLIFLLEAIKRNFRYLPRSLHLSLIGLLSLFLFMLSSKLIISIYLVYLFLWLLQILKSNSSSRLISPVFIGLVILSVLLVFSIPNPVSSRFYDIVRGNISIVRQDSFKPGDYFNGLQFRLLQWKFVPEILTENGRWWIGISPGDAQSYLNEKYLSKNMYSGDPTKGTRGYLVYNTHNQFLQTLLQTGIIGLVVLIATCLCMLKMAIEQKSRLTIFITIALLAWLFTESPFETQYGIMIFTFFPMLFTSMTDSGVLLKNQLPDRSLDRH